ncbi:universal stress protein [Pseudomonas sp.]|jgi:nucleotide-binding universal stress UspA family protein|uniref:universal stress protein n=1 Tax=Pseudomonas sp. TaxID=306 RepID=UPI00272A28C2|nr:universal stress protein [Pseudomonas sp.]
MFKHCVLAVDYSSEWDKALDYLPAIKPLLGFEQLTLVYVVETYRRRRIEDSEASAQGHLKELASRIRDELGVTVDFQVRSGFAASEVLDVAKRQHADAVITLNRSHSAGRELFLGNISMNLARMSRLPLVILSSDGNIVAPDAPVVFATDGSPSGNAARRCFEELVKQGRHGLAVWVDADSHDDEDAAHRILTDLSARHPNVAARRLRGSAADQINQTAVDEKAALVIVGKRGSTPISELMLGSTAESIARECRQPVLLVPSS